MCLAIPAQIIEIKSEDKAIVEMDGLKKEISIILIDELEVGDYVIVHVGFALNIIDEDEALKTIALFEEHVKLSEG